MFDAHLFDHSELLHPTPRKYLGFSVPSATMNLRGSRDAARLLGTGVRSMLRVRFLTEPAGHASFDPAVYRGDRRALVFVSCCHCRTSRRFHTSSGGYDGRFGFRKNRRHAAGRSRLPFFLSALPVCASAPRPPPFVFFPCSARLFSSFSGRCFFLSFCVDCGRMFGIPS